MPILQCLLAGLAAVVAVVSLANAEPVTLRFGQIPSTVHSVTSLYHFIAEKHGFFARE
jgi:hypothetical protein